MHLRHCYWFVTPMCNISDGGVPPFIILHLNGVARVFHNPRPVRDNENSDSRVTANMQKTGVFLTIEPLIAYFLRRSDPHSGVFLASK